MNNESKVRLVEKRGKTPVFLDADFNQNGDLVLAGFETGEAPEIYWGTLILSTG